MSDLEVAIITWAFTSNEPIGEGVDAYELACALSKKGVKLEVFSQKVSIKDHGESEMDNVNLHILPWGGKKYSARFLAEVLKRLILMKKIDLIHQLQYEKTFLPFFNKPYILTGYLPYKKYLELKRLTASYLPENENSGKIACGIFDKLLNKLQYHFNSFFISDNLLLKKASFIIARHKDFKNWLMLHGAIQDRIDTVPVCINTEKFRPSSNNNKKSECILFVGRLTRFKGVDILVSTMPDLLKDFPSLELWIIGDGPLKTHIMHLIEKFNIKTRVRLIGKVQRHMLINYYQSSLIFCNPSYYESFGITNLEAMACGLPVVSTKIGGYQKWL